MKILEYIPEVRAPKKHLIFKNKLLWTAVPLVIYYLLSLIPLYGLSPSYQSRFQNLSILLGAKFGSLITLGIGPIVTSSIIVQLLSGADLLGIDTNTREGKAKFQKAQKMAGVFFVVFENAAYVLTGSLPPSNPTLLNYSLLIIQLIIGGLILMMLDEVISRWGFGSGVSLFIAAGVARSLLVNGGRSVLQAILAFVNPASSPFWPIFSIVTTIVIFLVAVYIQSIEVKIPLSYKEVRGQRFEWPLRFVYTSNMPVILVSALLSSMQFWGLMMFNAGFPILGTFKQVEAQGGYRQVPASGLMLLLNPPSAGGAGGAMGPSIRGMIMEGISSLEVMSFFTYLGFMMGGAVLFSILWTSIGGRGPGEIAERITSSELYIPGFRQNKKIITKRLEKYIKPLTVISGLVVGAIAATANLSSALTTGTGILLSVLIIHRLYKEMEQKHLQEMHPMIQQLFK